ncbi:MAG: serine protein kinase RIO [Acidilobus sp.]
MSPHRIRIGREKSKVKDEDVVKTVDEVFDSFTNYHLYRLRNAIKAFKELRGSISAGKEAKVFWARGWRGEELAIKIYLTSSAEFKKSIKDYIVGDPRFPSIPPRFRDLVYVWARKEFGNLDVMRKAGVSVPEPKAVSGNVLVMQFLGENGYRAPLLAEAYRELDEGQLTRFLTMIADDIKRMVCAADLVHGDLSEYNIMIWDGRTWFIDVAQAVSLDHPKSMELLRRDLDNLFRFFSRLVETSAVEEELRGYLQRCLGRLA